MRRVSPKAPPIPKPVPPARPVPAFSPIRRGERFDVEGFAKTLYEKSPRPTGKEWRVHADESDPDRVMPTRKPVGRWHGRVEPCSFRELMAPTIAELRSAPADGLPDDLTQACDHFSKKRVVDSTASRRHLESLARAQRMLAAKAVLDEAIAARNGAEDDLALAEADVEFHRAGAQRAFDERLREIRRRRAAGLGEANAPQEKDAIEFNRRALVPVPVASPFKPGRAAPGQASPGKTPDHTPGKTSGGKARPLAQLRAVLGGWTPRPSKAAKTEVQGAPGPMALRAPKKKAMPAAAAAVALDREALSLTLQALAQEAGVSPDDFVERLLLERPVFTAHLHPLVFDELLRLHAQTLREEMDDMHRENLEVVQALADRLQHRLAAYREAKRAYERLRRPG